MTTLRVGMLTTSKGEWLCLVGNVSAGGSMIACSAELEPGEDVVLRLSNGRRLRGSVAWQRDGSLGLCFAESVPLTSLLASELALGQQQRSPRLPAACAAQIGAEGRVETASVIDISEGGIKIEAGAATVGAPVAVALPGLSVLRGRIKWAQDGKAGIAFDERLSFDTLSRWYSEHRTGIARAAGGILGALATVLPPQAAVAETTQQASVQTYGTAEILDPVGVVIQSETKSSSAPAKTAGGSASTMSDRVVSTSTSPSSPSTSTSRRAAGSDGGDTLIYQYN
jgi:hypothetical protein